MKLRDYVSCFLFCVLVNSWFYSICLSLLGYGDSQTDCVNSTHIVVNVKPVEESKTYDLVLFITNDREVLNKELKDCIRMLSLYQRSFSCKGIVFSDSEAVRDFASESNVMTIRNIARNEYGLPIIPSLFQRACSVVNGSFYGYINSDIVLNPRVFSLLPNVTKLINQGKLSPRLELAARIYKIEPFLLPSYFRSISTFTKVIDSLRGGILHRLKSADVFIFARTFPFHMIPPVVVGRVRVDNVLLMVPSQVNGTLVDLTFYAPNYHQGLHGFSGQGYKRQEEGDRDYNRQFSKVAGSLMNNGQYYFNSSGGLEVIDKKKYKEMGCSFLL